MKDDGLFSRLGDWLAREPETVMFWMLALSYLLPLWAFYYLPTQDGPAHMFNAQILKDYANPGAGYQTFYELRSEPLPNLTSHVLLAGLLHVFPPLVAERILVSLYVLGFAGSLRYFLGSFGPRTRPLSWTALLLVYNRSFWMGFWNYCLGLILIWVILGYCLRRRGGLHPLDVLVMTLLFTAAYFTHLGAFLLAFAGALLAAVLVPPRRILLPVLVVLTALPAVCLSMDYFERTGFLKARSAMRVVHDPLAKLHGARWEKGIWQELALIDDELLAHHAGTAVPSSLVLAVWWMLLATICVVDYCYSPRELVAGPGVLFPAVFGLLLLVLFMLIPDHLGGAHGGYLKNRVAVLPFLVWLACLREPMNREARILLRTATVGLLAMNLLLVAGTIHAGNKQLEQYTAGIEAVGRGQRIFVVQHDPQDTQLVHPLLHAAHYYCLGTTNVNLDNYEAGTRHFPVKFRKGTFPGRNNWNGYAHQDKVDVLLYWAISPGNWNGPRNWEEIFRHGPLRIFRRPKERR